MTPDDVIAGTKRRLKDARDFLDKHLDDLLHDVTTMQEQIEDLNYTIAITAQEMGWLLNNGHYDEDKL